MFRRGYVGRGTYPIVLTISIALTCGVLAPAALAQAPSPPTTPPAATPVTTPQGTPAETPPAAPPGTSPDAAPAGVPYVLPTLPPVHFVAADAPSLPEFAIKEGNVDVLAMQQAVMNPDHPEDTPLQKSMRAAIVDFLTTRRDLGEPLWKDSINPMVWVSRSLKGTTDWWQALIKIPAAQRPLFQGLPFIWIDEKPDPRAPVRNGENRALAIQLNNQALTALLESGDTARASEMLGRAVTADHSYGVPAYNDGVLQMVLHNREGAVRMFLRATDVITDPVMTERVTSYIKATAKLNLLLKKEEGSARRLYDENIDTAWNLMNAGQYDLAEYVAGQAVVLDPDEKRSQAHLIMAMCASKQGKQDKMIRWLTESFNRYLKSDSGRTVLLTLLREARSQPADAPANPPPATPPTTTAPAAAPAPTTPGNAPATPTPAAP